ncbi:MAG: hypothetical protein ACPLRZ_06570 [Thermovenabulum sp.]
MVEASRHKRHVAAEDALTIIFITSLLLKVAGDIPATRVEPSEKDP